MNAISGTIPAGGDGPEFFAGLDLGQQQDHSALAVVERTTRPDPERPDQPRYLFALRHLYRWQLGTPYTAVATDLKALYAAPPLAGTRLAIDATGCGRPVVDMIRACGIGAILRPFTITAGTARSGTSVPKKDLVSAVLVPLQERRLQFAEQLELTPVLARELETYRVRVTAERAEVFGAWRERDHDDLVLALALALHVGRGSSFAFAVAEM